MTSRQCRFAIPVVLALLIVAPGCQERHPTGQTGPLTVSLAYNNGQCTQNGSSGMIDVVQDQSVTYVPAAVNTPFYAQFSTCPFAAGKCPINSPQGTAQNVGAPTAASANTDYYYSSVTINNQSCNNPGQLGLHVKPITGGR